MGSSNRELASILRSEYVQSCGDLRGIWSTSQFADGTIEARMGLGFFSRSRSRDDLSYYNGGFVSL